MGIKYTKEFKTEAIRLGEREGVPAASEKLEIGVKTLCTWQRAQRLERENRELRDANYILKKAMGFMVGR